VAAHGLLHHLAFARAVAPEPEVVVRDGQAGMKHADLMPLLIIWFFIFMPSVIVEMIDSASNDKVTRASRTTA
jgi:hypothetical protein